MVNYSGSDNCWYSNHGVRLIFLEKHVATFPTDLLNPTCKELMKTLPRDPHPPRVFVV